MADFQHLAGLDAIAQALKDLPDRISRNVLRGATAAAATVVRKQAQQSAPVYTGPVADGHPPPGTLKKSIYAKQQAKLSNAARQVFFVTIYAKKRVKLKERRTSKADGGQSITVTKKTIPGAYYWRWVEYGTSKMQARPFMRPAFKIASQQAITAMRTYMAERIPKEVEKLRK